LSFAVAGVLHVVGYLGCLRDPRFFDIWGVKLRHCPRVKNHWFWRMNSYRP
jgi:type IV secretion system protein VirB3